MTARGIDPALVFTADDGWHLQGGGLQQLLQRRDDARADEERHQRQIKRHQRMAARAERARQAAEAEIARLARETA